MRTEQKIPISPRALRALRLRGVSSAGLAGSGPNGRILEADMLRAALKPQAPTVDKSLPPGTISSMRRAVAAKVADSFATVPHFYLRSEVDVTSLVQLREQNLETFEKCCGVRPSLTDFILRAMALALNDRPEANRIWQDNAIVQLPGIDVGWWFRWATALWCRLSIAPIASACPI
jgi:pyruvate dehydrogenase E2 component (dihydrolipoamide acetyltransferase)